jgi:O-antigen ligase
MRMSPQPDLAPVIMPDGVEPPAATPEGWPPVAPRGKAKPPPVPLEVKYIYVLWAAVLLDPHRWIASFGFGFMHQMLALLFVPLLCLLALEWPRLLLRTQLEVWCPPFLAILVIGGLGILGAPNHGIARLTMKLLLIYYLLVLGTLHYVRTARQAVPIVGLYFFQYLWWVLHARASGRVAWHPEYANYDSYGPLILMGLGTSFYFAQAAGTRRLRLLGYAVAAGCAFGVVASFARGVVLSLALLAVLMLVRSPHKGRMLGSMVVGLGVIVVAATILYPGGAFWREIMSSFTEGAKEGTGGERWVLWTAAMRVWQTQPILGIGANNFGIAASQIYGTGEAGGRFANPNTLWGFNLHNIYVQILAEFGIVGSLAFIWLWVDFWRKNVALRSQAAINAWHARSGPRWNLRFLSLGLESSMVALLACGFFYNEIYQHWMWTLFALNLLLYRLSRPAVALRGTRTRPVIA